MQDLNQAYRMLDTFSSIGAHYFDVTFLDSNGAKRGFRKEQSVAQLRNSLPKLFPGLTERRISIVVRPHSKEGVTLVQLDDLDIAALQKLEGVAFLTLATSPGNHQAWVAVSSAEDAKELARRLRKRTGADLSASGASRRCGTLNYKKKYEPDFPIIAILSAFPGRIVTPERLAELGLLAESEPAKSYPIRVSTGSRPWPDYQRCVADAPRNHSGTAADISRADFFWCMISAQRGHSIEEIAAKLMEESTKARENGERYARITAENATAAAERGRQRNLA